MNTSAVQTGGAAALSSLLEAEHMPATGELADVVRTLEKRYGAKYSRTMKDDGTVVVTFEMNESTDSFEQGDRFAAQGATTVEAVEKLRTRMEKILNAQG